MKIWMILLGAMLSCSPAKQQTEQPTAASAVSLGLQPNNVHQWENPSGRVVAERFLIPPKWIRYAAKEGTFAHFLQQFPLLATGSPVLAYDGRDLGKDQIAAAVLDLDVGNQDLQQCADAVMRLRGEYLYHYERYQDIAFSFLSDGQPRPYLDYAKTDRSYTRFRRYMNWIFAYANTQSLENDVRPLPIDQVQPGDFFLDINPGSFGHAVIIMDVASDTITQQTYLLLAQSYMPAQSMHVLKNLHSTSPWYPINTNQPLQTPEWQFEWADLRRFKE